MGKGRVTERQSIVPRGTFPRSHRTSFLPPSVESIYEQTGNLLYLNGIVRLRTLHQNTSLQSLTASLYSPNISRFSKI
jgi:hypothetical protein